MGELSNAAREQMNANADEVSMEKPAETPAPEAKTGETPPPEGEVKAEVEAKVDEAAPADLTPEQISQLASDPRIADAVLKGSGRESIETLLQEVLAEQEQTKAVESRRVEAEKTLDEAIKEYEETGSAEAFGKLAITQYLAAKQAKPIVDRVTADVSEAKEKEFLTTLNATAVATYPEVIEALTEEDYGKLARTQNESLQGWAERGFKFLADKQRDMLQSGANEAVHTADEAAKVAAAAAKARSAGGIGVLPGGTGVEKEAGGDTIGGLIRTAMKDAIQYDE